MYRTTGGRARAMCAIGALVALATTACSAEPAPPATLQVDRGTVATTVSASGTLVAITEQNLGFPEGGQLVEVLVQPGARVDAGQVLARLDDFELQQTLTQEQALLAQQQAELERARGGNSVQAAGRTLEQAKNILEATKEEVKETNEANKSATDRAREQLEFDKEVLERAEEQLRRDQEDCHSDSDVDEDEDATATTTPAPTASAESDSAASESDTEVTGASTSTSTNPCDSIEADLAAVEDAERAVLSSETELDTAEHQEDVDAASGQVSIANAEQSVVTAENDQDSADVDQPADIAAQEAVVRDAEAAVAIAQRNVDNRVLRAPVAGVVSTVNGTVGEFVDAASGTTAMAPGSSAALPETSGDDESATAAEAGTFIVLNNLDTFQLVVPFEESDAARVVANQTVEVTVDAIPDLRAQGSVLSIGPSGTSASGIVEYYATIVLAEGSDSRLRDGQTALADVLIETVDNVLRVPSAAISRDTTGATTVDVRGEDGQAVPTPFEAGAEGDEYTQVISGLREGQELLLPQTQQASTSGGGAGGRGGPGG